MRQSLVAVIGVGLAFPGAAVAELTHLYTFNTDAGDSVGNADGQLFGNAAINSNGELDLPGGGGDFVALDGAAINISSYTDATIEAWFTMDDNDTWNRVFDFGDRTVPNFQQGYVYYTPQGGGGGGLAVLANNGNRTEAPHGPLQTGQDYHLAFVIDDDANGGSDLLSVYLNGQLQTSVDHNRTLSAVSDNFALLGESLITGDPNFNGVMDEFRIYNHALSAAEVEASFLAGPTPLATMRLEVNTVAGDVYLVTDDLTPVTIDYYAVGSEAGALQVDDWTSLQDQGVGFGDGAGEGWEEADLSDAFQLGELFLLGASSVANDSPIHVGRAFDPTVFGPGNDGDLAFEFAAPGGGAIQGEVTYVQGLPGDFDQNMVVDGADFLVWQHGFGDLYDASDLADWEANFGASAGGVTAVAAVPEPTTLWGAGGLALLAGCRRWVRRRLAR